MPMQTKELAFINDVLGLDKDLEAFTERENMKRAALDVAFASLEGEKDSIRNAMKVRVVDAKGKKHEKAIAERGQEYAMDTFNATRHGRGLTKDDMKQVGEAMSKIVQAARSVLDKKSPDGSLLFDNADELALELFSPLIREGILPDNFVIDDYSEVQKLLNETFAAYKQTNEDARGKKELGAAGAKANRRGAGNGIDQFAAVMTRLASAPERLADNIGIDKDKRRRAQIGIAGVRAGYDIAMAGSTLDKWNLNEDGQPRIEASFERQLNPDMDGHTDPDLARIQYVQDFRKAKIERLPLPQTDIDNIVALLNAQDNAIYSGIKQGLTGYGGAIVNVITKLGLPGVKASQLTDALNQAHHEFANVQAAMDAAQSIDKELAALLDTHVRSGIGKLMAGRYAAAVDCEAIGEAAAKTKPDDQAIIGQFAAALEVILAREIDASLSGAGKTMAKEFRSNAQGSNLQKSLQKDPGTAFDPLVAVAKKAINKVLAELDPAMKQTIDARAMAGAINFVARKIDDALVASLKKTANANAADAFAGLYAAGVDSADAVEAAIQDPPAAADVLSVLAAGFRTAFAKAAPNPTDKTFRDAGKAFAAAFQAGADDKQLAADLKADLSSALDPVVKAAEAAIDAVLKKCNSLITQLADVDTIRAIASKAAFPDDGEAALLELEASEQEIKEYERQLILIDEGGIAAAELHTIEKLIEQLQRDKLIAEMIVSAGNILAGLGTTSMTIVSGAMETVTDTTLKQVVSPIKAAKLIVKFSVAMKQAHDRRILFQKFSKSLDLSKKSVSSLQSTLQGFFDNKVEQITFRAIEDAMTLVQIAAAILGSVPEPVTLATAKTMDAIATAVESTAKFTEMVFNEVQLKRGWTTTLSAIRNPRDRSKGLAALRLNPTLGMHAIAWAGLEKQPPDPVARMLLNDLGLNEQTLAVSGSEQKVRAYLETLLSEDRELIDPDLVRPKWIPKDVKLTGQDWAVAVTRASRDAKPPLIRSSSERNVLAAFKLTDQHDVDDLHSRAEKGEIEEDEWTRVRVEAARLTTALRAYSPVASDGSEHVDMAGLAVTFLKLATERERELKRLAGLNVKVQSQDVVRVTNRVNQQIQALADAAEADEFATIEAAFSAACEQIREVQMAGLDEDAGIQPLYKQLMTDAQALSKALSAMQVWKDEKPDWKGDLAADWTKARKKAHIPGKTLTGLTSLLTAAQQAIVDRKAGTIGNAVATAALQAVIDNIDQQLPTAKAGLALYLRKLKSGAKSQITELENLP